MNGPMAIMPKITIQIGKTQSFLKLLMVEFPVTFYLVKTRRIRSWFPV